jgi:hypothetical protein
MASNVLAQFNPRFLYILNVAKGKKAEKMFSPVATAPIALPA